MKILMYGWEFPPFFSGGLGIACHAIVQELAQKNMDVALVLPHTVENLIDKERVSIFGCDAIIAAVSNIAVDGKYPSINFDTLTSININSSANLDASTSISSDISSCFSTFLAPYLHITENEYLAELTAATRASTTTIEALIAKLKTLTTTTSLHELIASRRTTAATIKLTGKYGLNLLTEVCHYAIIAGVLAAAIPHDIIHAHDWLTVMAGIEAKKRSNKPLIFHVHALETDRSGMWVDTRIFAIEKYGLEQADKIIAVSEYTKNVVINNYGIAPDKIVVIHNGTYFNDSDDNNNNDDGNDGSNGGHSRTKETTEQRIGNEITGESGKKYSPFKQRKIHKHHKMVLFLGRLAQQKGPLFFIEIASKILAKRHDVHFVIAGTGSLLQEMIHRVAALHLGKYIHFTGFLEHKKIERIFRLADVYVMPSVSEPFGISCLEALSYNVPVVISKQSGVAEVLPNVVKADFWDVDDMASKVVALLDHTVLSRATLQDSRENLQDLTWGKAVDALIELYVQLAATQTVY